MLYILTFCFSIFSISSSEKGMGKLVNSFNKPIPYASIYLKGSNKGTTSNENGEFQIDIPNKTDTVTISCLGYSTLHLVADEFLKLDKIVLTEATHTLNEVIVRAVNLDKFLENAIYAFNDNFQQNQEADLYLRTYQKMNDAYIGFAEAIGLQFFSNCTIDNNPNNRQSSWQTYTEVRLLGFSNKIYTKQVPQIDQLPFINAHLKQMMPYESNLYSKKIIDEYVQNGENVWVVEMEPLESYQKRLNILDKRIAYYLDYFNIIKRYYITEKTKKILGIDIISDKNETRKKNTERKYTKRKEIIRFKYINDKCFLSYAKQDIHLKSIDNTSADQINEVLELFYDNFRINNYSLENLKKTYHLANVQTNNGNFTSGNATTFITRYPYPYFPGVGKVNNTEFWSKKVLAPFDYENMKSKILH